MYSNSVPDLTRSPHLIKALGAVLCLLLCYFHPVPALAQRSLYRFDHWTTDNGLPQNTVFRVIQTRDGYLWMTTFDGLARFDGVRFTVFDKSNSRGISSNRFTDLHETRDGTLLIGTDDAGLTVYRNGMFSTYTTSDGLPSNQIYRIFSDLNGEAVIGTAKGQVYLRDKKIVAAPPQYQNTKLKHYLAPSGAQVTISPGGVRQVKNGQTIQYTIKPTANNYFTDLWAYEDRRGNLWLDAGKDVYLLRDGQISSFPEVTNLHPVCDDAVGGVWFVRPFGKSDEGTMARFKDGHFTLYGAADGVLDATAYSIISDREGSIWIGTSRGLYRARKRVMAAYSTESGLVNHEVYPLLQTRNGEILIGSVQGINRARFRDGKFEVLSTFQPGEIIQALHEDAAGRLWIGIIGGLRLYQNGKVRHLPDKNIKVYENGKTRNLFDGDVTVYDIRADDKGRQWVASDKGLFRFDDDDLVARYTTRDGLPSDDIKVIHLDRRGALWLGTYGGLSRFKDGVFANYAVADGLAGNRVRTIYEDTDGTLWIGTYDDGLSRFRDGKFFRYRVEQGLFNNGVFQILEDRLGYFWIGCNKGIYRVSRHELNEMAEGRLSRVNSVAFGKDDGMFNTECNGGRQPAGFVAQDGKLWFPTMGGVVVLDPESAQVNPLPPPVRIESVRLERAEVDFSGVVTVAPGRRDIEIAYAGLSFMKPEQVKFRYKLEGLDTDWVDAGTRRVAYFPYLSPGSYTFRVIAANSDGIWNQEGMALKIVVQAPFYQTIWFAAMSALSVAGILFLAFRTRVAQLQRRQQEQAMFSRRLIESQESERKRIAAELHDGLGQSLLVIKNRALVGGMLPEDVNASKEQFDEISLAASQAIEETRRIAYDLRPYHLDRLGLTHSLEAMIERVASSIQFTVKVPLLDGVFSKEEEAIFYRIVQECVNNILKHSRATEALLAVAREEDSITLTIHDNGVGFAAEPGEARSRGYAGKAADSSDSQPAYADGFGLIGMAERVRMLNGTFTLESAPNQGTAITIKFPVR